MKKLNNYDNKIMGDTEMDFFKYKEDTSLEARKLEISVKKQRINKMLDERGMEALLLTKHPNFSWITAGGKNFVANCFDGGAVSILVTRQRTGWRNLFPGMFHPWTRW